MENHPVGTFLKCRHKREQQLSSKNWPKVFGWFHSWRWKICKSKGSPEIGGLSENYDIQMDWTIWKTADPTTTKRKRANSSGDTGYESSFLKKRNPHFLGPQTQPSHFYVARSASVLASESQENETKGNGQPNLTNPSVTRSSNENLQCYLRQTII